MKQADLFATVTGSAVFSPCQRYRYVLTREWAPGKTLAMVACNPSKATASEGDATVDRQVTRARLLGFGRFVMLNLFAFRSTDPAGLLTVKDPVGPDNDYWLFKEARHADMVICAWGNASPLVPERAARVKAMLDADDIPLHFLRMNLDGNPSHPLYLKLGLAPQRWTP